MKLLIVEDETAIATPLKRALEKQGFAVDYAATGQQGLRQLHANQYDCVLLDLNLPEVDGITIAQQLRKQGNVTPLVMLTARSQVYNKLEGFNAGADDYVVKPFHLDELIARIRAVIKRSSQNKHAELNFGPYAFFPEKNLIKSKQQEIVLTSKETAILEYLLRNVDRIVSTEELLEHVWDNEVNLFTDTVKTHMKTLRQKIDPEKKILITIRGKGYQIVV